MWTGIIEDTVAILTISNPPITIGSADEAQGDVTRYKRFFSSRTLLRKTSHWFDVLFESDLVGESIVLHVVDVNAFSIVMTLIHNGDDYPEDVSLFMLAMIATLADFLDCANALAFLPQIWMDKLWKQQKWTFQRDVVLWIYITQVFKDSPKHNRATREAIMLWPYRFSALGLHIKRTFVDELNSLREKSISSVLAPLQKLEGELRFGQTAYNFEEEAMILGTLHQLFPPTYFVPTDLISDCCSIAQIIRDITTLKEPSGGGRDLTKSISRQLGTDYFWEYSTGFGPVVAETRAIVKDLKGLDVPSDKGDDDEYAYEKVDHDDAPDHDALLISG
ncbi:hypothetical protein F5Y01DRAFT_328077 [Xylaria sp. FL0043]|nr:hypothetical protein F5Y01DRAFT_328077 [Xylaria sp. FL0043]